MRLTRFALAAAGLTLATTAAPSGAHAEQPYAPLEGTGRPKPLAVSIGDVTLTLGGRAQVQAAMYVGDDARLSSGDTAEQAGFRLRRARLGVELAYQGLEVGLEADLLESDGSVLHEAYVGYARRWDAGGFEVQTGVIKAPMSRSALHSSESTQNGERSLLIRMLAPEQQLGLVVGGDVWDEHARLLVGVFNGLNRNDPPTSGWERFDPKIGNRFGGVSASVRLDVEPIPGSRLLGDGVADLGKRDEASFGIGGGMLWNDGNSVGGLGWSADLAFKGWGIGFLAEWIEQRSKPVETPTQGASPLETTMRGGTAQLGYTILKDTLEVAARFDYIDQNVDLDDEGDLTAIAGTVSGYLLDGHLKLQLDYEHRTERHGRNLTNDVLMATVEGRF
jgi:hypothetical protein